MATYQELLDQLKNNEKVVRVFELEVYKEVNQKDYYRFIRYYWLDQNGILRSESAIIHVIVDDKGNETAYWKDRTPTVLAQQQVQKMFADEVEEIAKAKLQNFVGLNPIAVNESKKQGIFELFLYDSANDRILKKTVFVWKDANGNLNYKDISQA